MTYQNFLLYRLFKSEFIFDICCPTEQNSDLHIAADIIKLPIVVSNTQQFNATNNTVLPIVVSETEPPIVVIGLQMLLQILSLL